MSAIGNDAGTLFEIRAPPNKLVDDLVRAEQAFTEMAAKAARTKAEVNIGTKIDRSATERQTAEAVAVARSVAARETVAIKTAIDAAGLAKIRADLQGKEITTKIRAEADRGSIASAKAEIENASAKAAGGQGDGGIEKLAALATIQQSLGQQQQATSRAVEKRIVTVEESADPDSINRTNADIASGTRSPVSVKTNVTVSPGQLQGALSSALHEGQDVVNRMPLTIRAVVSKDDIASNELAAKLKAKIDIDAKVDESAADRVARKLLSEIKGDIESDKLAAKINAQIAIEADPEHESDRLATKIFDEIQADLQAQAKATPLRIPFDGDEQAVRARVADALKWARDELKNKKVEIELVGKSNINLDDEQRRRFAATKARAPGGGGGNGNDGSGGGFGLESLLRRNATIGKVFGASAIATNLGARIGASGEALSGAAKVVDDNPTAALFGVGQQSVTGTLARSLPVIGEVAKDFDVFGRGLHDASSSLSKRLGLPDAVTKFLQSEESAAAQIDKATAEQDRVLTARAERRQAAAEKTNANAQATGESIRNTTQAALDNNLSDTDKIAAGIARQRADVAKLTDKNQNPGAFDTRGKLQDNVRRQVEADNYNIYLQEQELDKRRFSEQAEQVRDLEEARAKAAGNTAEVERIEADRTFSKQRDDAWKLHGEQRERAFEIIAIEQKAFADKQQRERLALTQRYDSELRIIQLNSSGRTNDARREGIIQGFADRINAATDPAEKARIATIRDATLKADADQQKKSSEERLQDALGSLRENAERRAGQSYQADYEAFERAAQRKIEEAQKSGDAIAEAAARAEEKAGRIQIQNQERDRQRDVGRRVEDVRADTERRRAERLGLDTKEQDLADIGRGARRDIEDALKDGNKELAGSILANAKEQLKDASLGSQQTAQVISRADVGSTFFGEKPHNDSLEGLAKKQVETLEKIYGVLSNGNNGAVAQ